MARRALRAIAYRLRPVSWHTLQHQLAAHEHEVAQLRAQVEHLQQRMDDRALLAQVVREASLPAAEVPAPRRLDVVR